MKALSTPGNTSGIILFKSPNIFSIYFFLIKKWKTKQISLTSLYINLQFIINMRDDARY